MDKNAAPAAVPAPLSRMTLMVVAAMMCFMDFMLVMRPPGGVWTAGPHAGQAVWATKKVYTWISIVAINSISFFSSIRFMLLMTSHHPLRIIIVIALLCVTLIYVISVLALTWG